LLSQQEKAKREKKAAEGRQLMVEVFGDKNDKSHQLAEEAVVDVLENQEASK